MFPAVFLAGIVTGASLTAAASQYPFDKLHVFAEALSKIDSYYVDERDSEELLYDAIGGLTQGLDDHSIFMDPERYRQMQEQTSGEYFGVGVSVENREGRIIVLEPLEGSPALLAGIRAGDEIIAVDDITVASVGATETLTRIRGDRGTVVVLSILRADREGPFDVSVRRDRVRTRSVEAEMLDGGIGWLRIKRFQRQTADEVRRALVDLGDEAGGDLSGLVVDVRGNPGGYLSQAVGVADLWIGDGTIVSTLDRTSTAQKDEAHAAGTDSETRIAVLIDGSSASAAEILAGALKDTGRGKLIGYTSYGKGSVQQFFDLSDGSALKLTTARYSTPGGHNIHGSGISPDLSLGPREAAHPERDLGPLLDDFEVPPALFGDPELHVALAWMEDADRVETWFATAPDPPTSPDDSSSESPVAPTD